MEQTKTKIYYEKQTSYGHPQIDADLQFKPVKLPSPEYYRRRKPTERPEEGMVIAWVNTTYSVWEITNDILKDWDTITESHFMKCWWPLYIPPAADSRGEGENV